jgi:hypothetical protein
MRKVVKKLNLNRETVRLLNLSETAKIAGGVGRGQTDEPFCVSNAVTCGEVQCLSAAD